MLVVVSKITVLSQLFFYSTFACSVCSSVMARASLKFWALGKSYLCQKILVQRYKILG